MSVVILGATGFIGQRVVARLVARGERVTVLAREPAAALAKLGTGAHVLGFTLEPGVVRDAWEREVGHADAVVNLAGAGILDRPWTSARRRELFASRVDVTRALALTLAARARPGSEPKVLVSASAVGFYGAYDDDRTLTEGSPRGTGFLAELCAAWEAAASPARDAHVRVVHPRFGIVLGRRGGALPAMARPFRFHAGGPIGTGKQWVSWVHEDDATRVVELAVASPTMHGAYNVTAPHPVTMNEEARAIAAVLGTHARARVPGLALAALLGRDRAEVILTGQRVVSARLPEAGYTFSFPDLTSALRDLLP